MSFTKDSTADDVTAGLDLSGRTYLITGATSGIGKETARVLSARGARVIGTARPPADGSPADDADSVACDLGEPPSVRNAVAAITAKGVRLDGIIANAGIMALPEFTLHHGVEKQFLTNHVGHFILVTGLLDALTDDGRVVIVSSMAHMNAPPGGIDYDVLTGTRQEPKYSAMRTYGVSKLANILFARALSRRFSGSTRTANSLHPGVIKTNLTRHMPDKGEGLLGRIGAANMKSIPQGAATQTLLAAHPSTAKTTGEYWSDCHKAEPTTDATNDEAGERLWRWTEDFLRASA